MGKSLWRVLFGVSAIILLVGCSASTGGSTQNPDTITTGPVSIATDHTIYAPTESIHVTITNHLNEAIYAFDTRASCTILGLEQQSSSGWQGAAVASCPLGRAARQVKIGSGQSYTAVVQAAYPGLSKAAFPPGTYRLVLTYSSSAAGLTTPAKTTSIYSATLTVSGQAPGATPTLPIATSVSGAPIPAQSNIP